MRYCKMIALISLLALIVSSVSPVYAETALTFQPENEPIQSAVETGSNAIAGASVAKASLDNPLKAYLKVNTNSYGAPNPNTGYLQEVLSANTNIWVVEGVYCESVKKYYYYAGYTYNGENHRGYFCEDNVYVGSSRLTPGNVSAETKPAGYKEHTSDSGTVYDGPNSTYSVTGSVGRESIKLIRTDGYFNFIEYKVTSNGKYKRGYLDYKLIVGNWAELTERTWNRIMEMYNNTGDNAPRTFTQVHFFVQNKANKKFLDVKNWADAQYTRVHQWEFHGDSNQVFSFVYDKNNKWFTIQPLNTISNKWLAVSRSGAHADRVLQLMPREPDVLAQRFWVVGVPGVDFGYKIVPVSSYGTMVLTDRSDSTDTFVNQYYTDTTNSGRDIWHIRPYYIINGNNTNTSDYDRLVASEYADDNVNIGMDSENKYGDNDCANFASNTLEAGGIPHENTNILDQSDYTRWFKTLVVTSNTWTSSSAFSRHWGKASNNSGSMEGYKRSYQIIEVAGNNAAAIYLSNLCNKVYDMDAIQTIYLDEHPKNGNPPNQVNHTMLVYSRGSTMEYIQHSVNKLGDIKNDYIFINNHLNAKERLKFYVITNH